MNEPLPQPYLECIRRYNAGRHWHAHEVLEDLWRATGDPERRLFFQGVIQLAAAFVHAERGNMRGVQRLLAKSHAKLAAVPSPYLALDIEALLEAMADGRCRSASGGGGSSAQLRLELQAALDPAARPRVRRWPYRQYP